MKCHVCGEKQQNRAFLKECPLCHWLICYNCVGISLKEGYPRRYFGCCKKCILKALEAKKID